MRTLINHDCQKEYSFMETNIISGKTSVNNFDIFFVTGLE